MTKSDWLGKAANLQHKLNILEREKFRNFYQNRPSKRSYTQKNKSLMNLGKFKDNFELDERESSDQLAIESRRLFKSLTKLRRKVHQIASTLSRTLANATDITEGKKYYIIFFLYL